MHELPVDVATQLSDEQLGALADAVRALPSFVRTRGEEYALSSRVLDSRLEGEEVVARVRGARVYAVRWTLAAEGGADPLCSCPAAPLCKHACAVALQVLAAARRIGHLPDPADVRLLPLPWRRDADPPLPESLRRPQRSPFAPGSSAPPSEPRSERQRHEAIEGLTRWAERADRPARHLRVVLGLAGDAVRPAVTLRARLTGPRHHDAPRSSRQLSQLAADLRRDPSLVAPPQARLLRMLTEGELAYAIVLEEAPAALGNAQLNALLDRAAGSPFVTWDTSLPTPLARRAGITPGARAQFDGDDVRLVPECRVEGDELRLGLSLTNADGTLRPLEEALLFAADARGLSAHPTIALFGGTFHRVVEEPPRDVIRAIEEQHGLAIRREDAAVIDPLAARFPSVARALGSLTRTHDARPVVALDLRESDWLQVRLFAHAGSADWSPGRPLRQGERLFEFHPSGGWRDASEAPSGLEIVVGTSGPAEEDAVVVGTDEAANEVPHRDEAPAERLSSDEPAAPWRETPEPARVASALEWLAGLASPRADRRSGPPEPDVTTGSWLKLTARSAERLEALWRERPHDVAWFGNRAARELLSGHRRVRTRVSVLAAGIDWLSVRAEWESEGLALSEADVAKLRAAREPFVRLSGGWVRREDAQAQDALTTALADLGLEPDGTAQRVPLWQLAQADAASFEALAEAGADDATREAIARIRERLDAFTGIPRVPVPRGLTATLRPYQRDGLDFLAWTSSLGSGAVLADDMGLGKTVQALAWLEWLREREPDGGPALVVCPASVAHNWARESARFTPGLKVLVLGSGRERRAMLREVGAYDLVVTNYALLRRDLAHWRETPLRAAILDEAQNVKNPDAAVSRAALELRAPHRIALTGTPLENRALDLWSILAFTSPGLLGSRRRFVQRYDRPDAPPFSRRLLAAKLRPVLIRRVKAQVERDLPSRIEERLDCEMTPGQRKLYLAELVRTRALLDTLLGDPDALARRRIVILAALTRLRQICCHPALAGGHRSLGSGKFDALFELLEPLRAEGHKVLVFSQFVRCLDLIGDAMKRRGLPFHVLTGETSTKKREQVVQAFSEDPEPSAFLISLKAGGTGLNLTAASDVVLFDPWWNPAVEAQAIDRTHRIGQTRAVVAYRLFAEGTIEERIAELQRRKESLVRDVLGEDGFARSLTREDLAFLLAE
jgi:superfamily II DNA or RNA helicase